MCNPPAHRWTLNKKYDHVDKSNIQYKLRHFFTFITISIFILSMMNWSIAEVHGDYEYVICDGNIVITGYNGEDYDIVIPEYIDGIPVKEVQSLGIQSGIEAITIPDSVTVSEGALGLCFALSEITVSENHPELRLIDGVLFSKDRKTIICYPSELAGKEYSIPEGTEIIGEAAFWDCAFLEKVNLPYGIKRIGVDAFGACGRLTILDIPSSVESIGEMAFANSALKKLDLRKNRITEVSNRLVYGCWQLSEIYLPETVVIIGDEAFAFIPVTSIVLPSALQQIGMNPFRYCNCLQSLSFSSPSERFSIVYPFLLDIETDSAICCVGQASGSIEVPAIRAIGDYCCTGCEQITNIVIPDTVSYIGKEAFSFCINLETVRIGKTKNLEIRDCAFEECYNLSLFSVEGDVISIGQDAFRRDEILTTVISSSNVVNQYFEKNHIVSEE